jgi:hypothetical protein
MFIVNGWYVDKGEVPAQRKTVLEDAKSLIDDLSHLSTRAVELSQCIVELEVSLRDELHIYDADTLPF